MWISASLTSLRHQLAITEWNGSGSSIAGYQEKTHFAFLAVLWHPLKFRCTFLKNLALKNSVMTLLLRLLTEMRSNETLHAENTRQMSQRFEENFVLLSNAHLGQSTGKIQKVKPDVFVFFVLEIYRFCCHIHVLNVLVLFYMLVQLKLQSKKEFGFIWGL